MAQDLILIVEDNEKNLKLVRDLLQFNGYETMEAMTAEEGIKIAGTHHPALILMDIQLPGMDGITALQHLRADPLTKATPVFAIKASVMTAQGQEILEAGFDVLQAKPINIKEFIPAIKNVLNSRLNGQDAR